MLNGGALAGRCGPPSTSKRRPSILLTVLVGEAWSAIDTEAPSGDDEYLVEIVREMIARLEKNVLPSEIERVKS